VNFAKKACEIKFKIAAFYKLEELKFEKTEKMLNLEKIEKTLTKERHDPEVAV
jgi:hypothetical protein